MKVFAKKINFYRKFKQITLLFHIVTANFKKSNKKILPYEINLLKQSKSKLQMILRI